MAIVPLVVAACASPASGEPRFPSFVYSSAATLDSYRAAAALPPQVTTRIPCYCGCAAPAEGHRYLRDCFYQADGSLARHAAGCDICGQIAGDVQSAYEKGMALKDIRTLIDSKYSKFGTSTDTPPVEP